MEGEKLYRIYFEEDGRDPRYEAGLSHGMNGEEAINNFFGLKGISERHTAEEITIRGFKITLTPLEQKVSS